MGIRLVGECVRRFAHLKPNPYKALVWMCCRTLDDPNPERGIAAGLWFADWPELATAIGWTVPTDTKARDTMRNDVSKVCRELVDAGAIEKVPHPNRIDNAAYRLVLQPTQSYIDARKKARARQSAKPGRSVPAPVDNVLVLDFGPVDTDETPQGGNDPGGEGGNDPGGEGRFDPGPTNRNQEPTQEGAQEGAQEKVDDDSTRRPQVPGRARPVDNPTTSEWAGTLGMIRDRMAAASSANARHARPTPVGNLRPDRE